MQDQKHLEFCTAVLTAIRKTAEEHGIGSGEVLEPDDVKILVSAVARCALALAKGGRRDTNAVIVYRAAGEIVVEVIDQEGEAHEVMLPQEH